MPGPIESEGRPTENPREAFQNLKQRLQQNLAARDIPAFLDGLLDFEGSAAARLPQARGELRQLGEREDVWMQISTNLQTAHGQKDGQTVIKGVRQARLLGMDTQPAGKELLDYLSAEYGLPLSPEQPEKGEAVKIEMEDYFETNATLFKSEDDLLNPEAKDDLERVVDRLSPEQISEQMAAYLQKNPTIILKDTVLGNYNQHLPPANRFTPSPEQLKAYLEQNPLAVLGLNYDLVREADSDIQDVVEEALIRLHPRKDILPALNGNPFFALQVGEGMLETHDWNKEDKIPRDISRMIEQALKNLTPEQVGTYLQDESHRADVLRIVPANLTPETRTALKEAIGELRFKLKGAEPTNETGESETPLEGNYIWAAKDSDIPVRVIGSLGRGADGREYVAIEGSRAGVPLDELRRIEPKAGPADPLGEIIDLSQSEEIDPASLQPGEKLTMYSPDDPRLHGSLVTFLGGNETKGYELLHQGGERISGVPAEIIRQTFRKAPPTETAADETTVPEIVLGPDGEPSQDTKDLFGKSVEAILPTGKPGEKALYQGTILEGIVNKDGKLWYKMKTTAGVIRIAQPEDIKFLKSTASTPERTLSERQALLEEAAGLEALHTQSGRLPEDIWGEFERWEEEQKSKEDEQK